MIEIKQKAPNFRLKNQGNTFTSLNDLIGHKVFLYFFTDINDLRCQVHAAHYAMEIENFQKHNYIVVGISGNSVEDLMVQSKRLFIPFLLLSDFDCEVRKAYQVWNEKITFGNAYHITNRCSLLIDEKGIITKTYKRAHIMKNGKEVIEFLDKKKEKEEWRKLSRRKKEKLKRLRSNL